MALKTFKPMTPGQRNLVLIDRSSLWKGRPVKTLTEGLTGKGKVKRFKGIIGKRSNVKKAIVTLEDGQRIDITTGL